MNKLIRIDSMYSRLLCEQHAVIEFKFNIMPFAINNWIILSFQSGFE